MSETFKQPLKKLVTQQIQKYRHRWLNLKKIEMDCNCGYGKPVSLTVFPSSFLVFVLIDIILGRHILLGKKRCDFVILKFHRE